MKIWGHPRSGNHYLASAIHRAFYRSDEKFALRVMASGTGHWSQRQLGVLEDFGSQSAEASTVPWGLLLGSHVSSPPTEPREAIYVYRDGRDVALSIYNWTRFRGAHEVDIGLSEYLRRPIDWIGSPGHRAPRNALLWERWRDHVSNWLQNEDVLAVRYEDLVIDLNGQLKRIANRFNLALPEHHDGTVPVGWNASKSKNRLARWRGILSAENVALYNDLVPHGFAGRWDD